ncbi:HNH endonuclease signature motif containing protein [Enteractinococcus coprophilus]|uniref:HNH nuclease domain-containing protein n=1 Tax=Enteractinococcus coprophilus TaxID=1027633 RepID=A0A543AFZ7_9MICC|nr:HNH endonuclease signature motif containing protein [Enteractinococcus coprophilus]TQL71477.1 hypothetical protein FB556_1963 [Enteractinococcus coprophilus]
MANTDALSDLGIEVPMPEDLNLDAVKDLSPGQLAYLKLVVNTEMSQRMSDPATTFAQFTRVSGADWTGHEPQIADPELPSPAMSHDAGENEPTHADGTPVVPPRPLPTPPECPYDTVPMIAEMLRRSQHLHDATMTSFARQLQPMFTSQPEYFGTPEGINAFKDSTAYFKEVLRFSWQTTKKIHERMPYVTWNPGQDPTMGIHQPKLPKLAEAFTQGTIPAENLDRIVALDQQLTKYVRKVRKDPEYKDAIMREFESTLIEAAESSTPDAFTAARGRWANRIAHHIDPDGPPIVDTLRKQPDNALKTQDYSDGSGRISMHATPEVYAEFKNFAVNQLNQNGAPVKLDDALAEFLSVEDDEPNDPDTPADDHTDASPEEDGRTASTSRDGDSHEKLLDEEPQSPESSATLDDLTIDRDPDALVAEDDEGKPVTQQEVDLLESLTPGQILGTLIIGIFKTVLSMDPDELRLKKSHGAASTLTVIQDIETAYKTLDIGALPEAVRRPRSPDAFVPTVVKRENPDDPKSLCRDPDHLSGTNPRPWTSYISEALNIGAMHPKDAEKLACDSQLVGQIWNKHHSILNQHRALRAFNRAQRRAILARDRGCQAPGCTIIAAWCQIHHLKAWEHGGNTDIENAITLCAHHHGAVHNGKWTIHTINGAHFFQPAHWLDPAQPLLRNLYWAL